MRKIISYEISEIVPYVNWLYFYHAWGLDGKSLAEKERMKGEALFMLEKWEGVYRTSAIFGLWDANSDGDDILVWLRQEDDDTLAQTGKRDYVRIPMLRQQTPSAEGCPHLCLADFIRPSTLGEKDRIGVFCTSVDGSIPLQYKHDIYLSMLAQTLCDRLAEATAEKMHEEVRRRYWGYAPHEHLTMEETLREEFQGIRPAVGYPSIPDTSINFVIDELLGMGEIHVRLTESGMMMPHASVSGFMFAHPKARYFDVGRVGDDQLRDYARRRGLPVEMARRFLQTSLMKKK